MTSYYVIAVDPRNPGHKHFLSGPFEKEVYTGLARMYTVNWVLANMRNPKELAVKIESFDKDQGPGMMQRSCQHSYIRPKFSDPKYCRKCGYKI